MREGGYIVLFFNKSTDSNRDNIMIIYIRTHTSIRIQWASQQRGGETVQKTETH